MSLKIAHDQAGNHIVTMATGKLLGRSTAGAGAVEELAQGDFGGVGPGATEAFPIGSVFLSVVSTNPATLLGYGTWSSFGAGRVLVGRDAGDTDFDTAEETGGAKTVNAAGTNTVPTISGSVDPEAAHTHSVTSNVGVGAHSFTQPLISWPAGVPVAAGEAAHTHGFTATGTVAWPAGVPTHSGTAISDHTSHTHAYTAILNHTHPHNLQGGTTGSTTGTNVMASAATGGSSRTMAIATSNPTGGVATASTQGPDATITHTVSSQGTVAWPAGVPTFTGNAINTGVGASHTHTITWPAGVPTAGSGAVDAHSVTNNAVTSGVGASHSHTAGGLSATAPTFTGTATSVVQPYIVVYMWKRTA